MSFIEKLRAAFASSDIRHIAIVDDAYDLPRLDVIRSAELDAFVATFEDASDDGTSEDAVATICSALSLPSTQVPEIVGKDDRALQVLWELYRGAEHDTDLGSLLRPLFVGFDVDRRDKRRQLESLEQLIFDASGIVPERFDSQARTSELLQHDLIFLDFYLEAPQADEGGDPGLGRHRSISFLKELVEASPKRTPLVMLISSEATADDLEAFREEAQVLASAIQFLPKKHVEADPFRAQGALLALVASHREVTALWALLGHWQNSVASASGELLKLVRQLDLTDYGYLQKFRMNTERVPLSAYLIWLFNGYLADRVENGLRDVAANKLVETIAQRSPASGRIAPTKAIASLYGAVTTSSIPAGDVGFELKAWAGDVFIKAPLYDRIFGKAHAPIEPLPYEMPDVLGIVTPACDLVPGRLGSRLKTVSAIGGTLFPLNEVKTPTINFVVINEEPFHVEWDAKWPVTIPVEQLDGASAFEGRYLWVSRMRETYHADLQQTLVKQIGRIGLPVVPTIPQSLGLRIVVRNKDRTHRLALARSVEDRCAWTFQAGKGERACHMREEIAWLVRDWVNANIGDYPTDHQKKLREEIDADAFVTSLQEAQVMKRDTLDVSGASVRFRLVESHDDQSGEGCDKLFVVYLEKQAAAHQIVDEAAEAPSAPLSARRS